jgi:ECF sigma factor
MTSAGSVSNWIEQLKSGDPVAAQELWERYFHRLVGLAQKRLHGAQRREADDEDVALSAFDGFCRGVTQGRFPQLGHRNNLWQRARS